MPTSVDLSQEKHKLHLEHRNFGPTPKAYVAETRIDKSRWPGVKVTETNHRNRDRKEYLMRMGIVVFTGIVAVVAVVLFLSLQ